MARFIALCILSNEAGDVGLVPASEERTALEKRIELLQEAFPPAVQSDQPLDVMRDKETVLPGIGLRVVLGHGGGTEWLNP